MDYIAPFSMTVASVSGRSVELKKGEPTFCPPQMHAELIARGCVPAEEIPEEPVKEGSEPRLPAERETALFAAFEVLALRNKRGDFSGTGVPHAAALAKELGWDVDAKERDATWAKFQADKAV